jgi:hypothetical protein
MGLDYDHTKDWFYEGNVSKHIVDFLEKSKYNVIKHNSNKISDRGIDIIAELNGNTELIEVKGYPTEYYTKGDKKGQKKPTNPKLQAKHWFSEAILSSVFNYADIKYKNKVIALGLPFFPRYKELIEKVHPFFYENKLTVKVYFVNQNGNVTITNL